MIDHERRFVFVHVPKTAGMSIYEALSVRRGFGHLRLHDHEGYDPSYFSFAFVRNPWDRAVSTYAYLRRGGRGNKFDLAAGAVLDTCDTFDRFARQIDRYMAEVAEVAAPGWGVPLPSGPGAAADLRYPHLFPQVTWTHDASGLQVVERIGRFEQIDHDLAEIGERIRGLAPLPHRNASARLEYRSYYGRRSRRAIARAYSADIERFGYTF